MAPAVMLAPVVASRWATTPSIGARIMNEPAASAALPVRAALYCARLASAAVSRAFACSSAARASSSRFAGAAPAAVSRSALSRSWVASASAVCASSRARCNCGRSPGADGGGCSRANSWPRATRAPSVTSRTRVSRPSMGAATSAAPPGRGSRRAGTVMDSRTACSRDQRCSEVECPLLLLEKADAWCVIAAGGRRGVGCLGVRIDVHLADGLLIG